AMCLPEERLLELWPDGDHPNTVFGAVQSTIRGTESKPHVERIDEYFGLLPGDLALSSFEDMLAQAWLNASNKGITAETGLRQTATFSQLINIAAHSWEASVVLVDVGPNLGALNRSALVAASDVVVPLAPDLFSLQGLRNLGPSLLEWREGWKQRLSQLPENLGPLPEGAMTPIGYVIMQHAMRLDRPVLAYGKWMKLIPNAYHMRILGETDDTPDDPRLDDSCIATLKNYRSLMPLAMEARKPMFMLRVADGALGAQQDAVQKCYDDFRDLTLRLATLLDLDVPVMQARKR
ncbi:MAG: ParA family protein, partial [Vulcanimicrobiaceae bacterium]